MAEFIEPADGYKTFNEFFYRKLKPDSRIVEMNPGSVLAPADSMLIAFQKFAHDTTFFVKGCEFDLKKFVRSEFAAYEYQDGTLLIFHLAPTDYHRFHFPFDCIPSESVTITGKFESVNPIVYKSGINPLTENERHLIELDSKVFGKVLFVPVGAMFVGKIHETFAPNSEYQRGDEMGYFAFGASSIVMIFKPNTIILDHKILQKSQNQIETQVKFGQVVAKTMNVTI